MKKMYDTHCHVMNLSHPNISAMVQRLLKDKGLLSRLRMGLGLLMYIVLGRKLFQFTDKDDRILNLLAIMESEAGDYLLQMEEDLRKRLGWHAGPVLQDGTEKKRYDRMVLLPLLMDFGLKRYPNTGIYYQVRWKPIVSQVLDICLGIKKYYLHVGGNPTAGGNPTGPLFEIYPFMGINTKNYQMKTRDDGTIGLEDLLSKYFKGFEHDTVSTRRENLKKRDWRDFNGDIDTIGPYDFIGIKVYPPLGFNPWPEEWWEEDASGEMKKVCHLYAFCQERKIPITSHCSKDGFLVDDKYKNFSHPSKWRKVLEEYPDLRLNLAHFGADDESWRTEVADLVLSKENVYTDISYRGVDMAYYNDLRGFIYRMGGGGGEQKLLRRILFGSDFMACLLDIESYSAYMKNFVYTSAFTADEKDHFASANPERFLFIA